MWMQNGIRPVDLAAVAALAASLVLASACVPEAEGDARLAGAAASDPLVADGEVLYAQWCAFCHGDDATGGDVGRSVVGARSCSTRAAIDHFVPGMEFLQLFLLPDDVEAIAAYLNAAPVTAEERYAVSCGGCHGRDGSEPNRVGEGVVGESASEIFDAIHDEKAMQFLDCLPPEDVDEIAGFLGGLPGGGPSPGDHGDSDTDGD